MNIYHYPLFRREAEAQGKINSSHMAGKWQSQYWKANFFDSKMCVLSSISAHVLSMFLLHVSLHVLLTYIYRFENSFTS